VARRDGFTLVEALIVVVVVSLTLAITLPKFNDAVAQSNLTNARSKVTSLYASARSSSASSGRATYVHFAGDRVYVTATPRRLPGAGTQDTLTPPEDVYTQYGVDVDSNQDSIRIDPAGLSRDSARIVLTKGARADTVRISRFGRVLK